MSQLYDIVHFPTTSDMSDRLRKTESVIRDLEVQSVLDIGGTDYYNLCQIKNIHYTSLNIEEPQKTGTGGYHKAHYTVTYDGKSIPFAEDAFDLVVVNFVLHHTPDNALDLLKQIKKIAAKYVLIGEDVSGLDYEMAWHRRNFNHQPGGIFRSDQEWRTLFELYGMTLLTQYVIHRDDDVDNRKIYRAMYLLTI